MTESPLVDSGFAVPVFSLGDDPIACLNKAMAFLTAVASLRVIVATRFRGRQRARLFKYWLYGYATCVLERGETMAVDQEKVVNSRSSGQILDEEATFNFLRSRGFQYQLVQGQSFQNNVAFHNEDLLILMNLIMMISRMQKRFLWPIFSIYGSDVYVISEVPNSETYLNDMDNQSVHALQDFEQSPVMDFTDNEISSDSNIIPYSQYLQETQQATVQDTNLQAQQDSMILSVIEQMSEQMINHVNN
ncbi:hypothetical protein Tco_1074040 [Tanacetum coccineum]